MRFFAAFRAVIIVLILMISLYSCTAISMTPAKAGNEIASTRFTPPNSFFYHPLIYQVAMSQAPDHLARADNSHLEKFSRQTMLLLQVSFNSFYLLFLVILIMLCLALTKERNFSFKRLLSRRTALQ